MNSVKCRDCGEIYSESETTCPSCGSKHKVIYLSIEPTTLCVEGKIEGMQGKNPTLPSRKKLRWEWISKDTIQRGDGITRVHHYRLRDRDKDIYEETVTDLETGKIIHECKEPLSKHIGHGSDKNREPKDN